MPTLAETQSRLAAGEPSIRVLDELCRASNDVQLIKLRQLVWQVGCPAQEIIKVLGDYEAYVAQVTDRVQVAAHTSRLTTRITLAMPWITAAVCQWFGLSTITGLFSSTLGWLVLLVASSLIWLAGRNASRLRQSHLRFELNAGFDLQLAAVALLNGFPMSKTTFLFSTPRKSAVELVALAQAERRTARLELERNLATLPERLILNTGLLVLPATLLLTVGSVALAGINSLQ